MLEQSFNSRSDKERGLEKKPLSVFKEEKASYPNIEEVVQYLEYLKKRQKPVGIILFGSIVIGEYPFRQNEVDVLVIFKENVDFIKKSEELRKSDPSGIIEPFCYGVSQIGRMLRERNPFILEVFDEGVLVSGFRSSEIKKLEALFEKMAQLEPVRKRGRRKKAKRIKGKRKSKT